MFKVNNRNIRTRCEICSKWTIKTCWTYFTPCSSDSIVNFEKINVDWVTILEKSYIIDVWECFEIRLWNSQKKHFLHSTFLVFVTLQKLRLSGDNFIDASAFSKIFLITKIPFSHPRQQQPKVKIIFTRIRRANIEQVLFC